jgi:hypothetical protein
MDPDFEAALSSTSKTQPVQENPLDQIQQFAAGYPACPKWNSMNYCYQL